jgi:hypothetical protein
MFRLGLRDRDLAPIRRPPDTHPSRIADFAFARSPRSLRGVRVVHVPIIVPYMAQ